MTAARPGPSERLPTGWAVGAGLFALALLPRAYVAATWARAPVWDGFFYDFAAQRIAAGLGYSDDLAVGAQLVAHPWCHYPVGYSGVLALVYRLVGHGPYLAPMLNALIGAALAVVVYRLTRHVTTETRARVAGLLTALHPGLIVYSALVMTELLAAVGVAAAAWVAARCRGRLLGSAVAGALLGLTTLVRPQTILLAPAVGLFAPRPDTRRPARHLALRAGTIATAVALAVVAPWTIRNCVVMDGCAFVSTNAGWNLAIGSFPRATGRFTTLRASDGCHIITGQVQQDRCWFAAGMAWIRGDPERWLQLIPRKLGETFDHESYAVGYLAEADPSAWPEHRRRRTREVLTTSHGVLLWLAALGVIAWPRARRRLWQLVALCLVAALGIAAWQDVSHPVWTLAIAIPLLVALRLPGAPKGHGVIGYASWAIATVCLTHALFFGEDRYHMAISPLLCLLAACALRGRDAPAARDGG